MAQIQHQLHLSSCSFPALRLHCFAEVTDPLAPVIVIKQVRVGAARCVGHTGGWAHHRGQVVQVMPQVVQDW